MKLLVDNNLSLSIVNIIKDVFPYSAHVKDALMGDADDISIWEYARQHGYTILTKDNECDHFIQVWGCPPKVIHLICGNQTTQFIIRLLLDNKLNIIDFINADPEVCLLKLGSLPPKATV